MIRNLFSALVLTATLLACDSGEKDALRKQVDSLSIELERSHAVAETLVEVGTMIDSIDASRHLLRINMEQGTTYNDYVARMQEINDYVKETERKIENLERSANKASRQSSELSRAIARMRADLESKTQEIALLQEKVEKYRNENQNLVNLVGLQEAEIIDKQAQIETKNQELAFIEARVQELMIQSKISEADAYFTRAVAVEEAANRTRLAPRKKKETLKEAIDLYKKALSLGKTEAQAKITELEARL